MQHQPQPQPVHQQHQQQHQQQRRGKHSKQPSHLPGTAPYLRILFPRNIQQREPVPQLLNQPHPDLDAEAYHFLAFLVRDFIQTWYSTFSSDPQLVTSVVNVVIEIARELERRSQEVDWVGLLLLDVPEVLRRHYVDYRQATQKLETAYAPNQTIESIFHGLQPHFALQDGEESEKEYLRQLADELLRILLPKAEYESDCVRWLIREILACLVLRSLVEILTEPDMINYIVNTLLQDFEPTDEEYEAFLQKAADQMDASDDKFSAFLASLVGSKGRSKLTHRSSTPNIKPTDEMVDLLQDAQTSSLAAAAAAAAVASSSKNAGDRPQPIKQSTIPLPRPERNDDMLSRRLVGAAPLVGQSATSQSNTSARRVPVSPQNAPLLEPPLQIPAFNRTKSDATLRLSSTSWSNISSARNTPARTPNRSPQPEPGMLPKWKSKATWAVTKAPAEYTTYMINNVFVPLSVFLVAFLNFMLVLPSKITLVSQSLTWIYAELDEPEHTELEAGIFRLVKEIFYLEERNQVIWRQWELMGWPLVRTLGGGAIDRVLAHGVYWIFAEPRLVTYIQAGRRALWPDPTSSPPRPRGVDEMEKARREAERRILRTMPAPMRDTFFGEQGVHHLAAAREALEPFQNKHCNKHLIYIALDLLLSKITPEVYPDRL
ncbi:hypothetical protein BGZ96_006922 [Linnemannia gamsii]|uniref:PXA domain-containing protein n=1 Tax=Linnemannia gamsii TaxID=64522 RepID=A0ABQ7K325_9FUNG|nr:hypothetical protein BGZ96_006922 [Linnemannia gamsii]